MKHGRIYGFLDFMEFKKFQRQATQGVTEKDKIWLVESGLLGIEIMEVKQGWYNNKAWDMTMDIKCKRGGLKGL